MTDNMMEQFKVALREKPDLVNKLSTASGPDEFERIAADAGFTISAKDLFSDESRELSDAELETVSGGYTFPQTDWIYCDNPWTNAYCTMKC